MTRLSLRLTFVWGSLNPSQRIVKEDNLIISVKEKKESKGARSFLEVYLCTNGAMSVYRNYI